MKRHVTLIIALMMFLAVVAGSAEAQASGAQRLRARIPFAFNVGNKSLPAGEYTIIVLNPTSDRKVLRFRSADGRLSAIVNTSELNTHTPEDVAKLVFNRYGDQYYFAKAQIAGDSVTLTAVKSNAERNIEHAIASKAKKTTVTINAAL
ncbi:MAG TPA: hypothetical protein VLB87_04010 [Pyrinomonadaceae bacterium]|nr:hypothetical protein [Pyrinomonadaceae bacterium]